MYEYNIKEWKDFDGFETYITIDQHVDGWDGEVGYVNQLIEKANIPVEDTVAFVCGPPIMIKFTQPVLDKLGYGAGQIIMSLENRMKCGIGMCGRCNIGKELVCKDGPVFTRAPVQELPLEY